MELAKGRQLGKYRLERLLGTGGMGAVWEAHDGDLDRRVALKVLRPALASDVVAQVRLLREARAMARLRHPNVITVFDATTLDGQDLVAMELIEGETMAGWLAREPRDANAIVATLLAAGRGLAAAHAAGMVHRDFKPHNVLVERGGRVLVTDFGLARASGESPVHPTGDDTGHDALVAKLAAEAASDATAALRPRPNLALAATAADIGLAETAPAGNPKPAIPLDVTASLVAAPAGAADTLHAPAAGPALTPRGASGRGSDRSALDSPLTRTGTLLGTPAYMAPEQFAGHPADARADQFAFCVTAWEALAGERPFQGNTVSEIIAALGRELPPADRIPRRLRAILVRGLSRNPKARWPSVDVLLSAIERAWRRPRRLAGIAGVVAALGAASVAFATLRSTAPTERACPLGVDAVAKVWSPEKRVEFGMRIGPLGEGPSKLLDRWAATWVTTFDANCARPADPDYTARRACLEAQRDDVNVMLTVTIPKVGELIQRLELARLLPSPESCERAPRSIAPPLPADPTARVTILTLRGELAQLRGNAGHGTASQDALALALIERSKATGFPPIYAEALYVRALLHQINLPDSGGERKRALVDTYALFETAANAAEAAGHDRFRVDSLLGQLECATDLRERLNDIDTVIARTEVAVTRLGDPANQLVLDALRSQVALSRGRWSETIEFAERARRGWQERGAPDTAARLGLLEVEARELRHAPGDLIAARKLLEELVTVASRPNLRGALTARLGVLLWRLGKVSEAGALLDDPILRDGAGDPAGGSLDGSVTGIAVGTLVDPDTDAARAARRSYATITIADPESKRGPWELPADEAGHWQLDHVPPGRYTVTTWVVSSLADRHGARTTVTVTAHERTAVPVVLPVPLTGTEAWPRADGVAIAITTAAGTALPKTTAALRAQVATAAWFSITDVSASGRVDGRDQWSPHFTLPETGTVLECRSAGSALAEVDQFVAAVDDPPPDCVIHQVNP